MSWVFCLFIFSLTRTSTFQSLSLVVRIAVDAMDCFLFFPLPTYHTHGTTFSGFLFLPCLLFLDSQYVLFSLQLSFTCVGPQGSTFLILQSLWLNFHSHYFTFLPTFFFKYEISSCASGLYTKLIMEISPWDFQSYFKFPTSIPCFCCCSITQARNLLSFLSPTCPLPTPTSM